MPFRLVDRLADFGIIVCAIPLGGLVDILQIAARGVDSDAGIVFPLVRIADLDGEGGELLMSTLLGLVAHPGEAVDMLAESHTEILHKILHILLVLLREILLDIELADSLAKHGVGDRHRSFPAGFLLLLAGEHTVIEFEVSLLESLAEQRGGVGYHLIDEIVAHLTLGECRQIVVEPCDIVLAAYIDLLHRGKSESGEVGVPVDIGIGGLECVEGHDVVAQRGSATLLAGHLMLGYLALHSDHIVPDAGGVFL